MAPRATVDLRITGDASGAKNAAQDTEKATGGLAAKLSRYGSQISGKLGAASGVLQKLGVDAGDAGKLIGASGIGTGVTAAGAAVAAFAIGGVKKFADLTAEVRGFQRIAGGTAESASKLVYASKQLGIAPEAAVKAFGKLSTGLGSGKIDLAAYGVEVAKNKDGTTNLAGTVLNLSKAYQGTTDPTAKAALANAAFGKSWQTLAPLLGKGRAELEQIFKLAGENHQIFSQDDLEKGRLFTVAMKDLNNAFKGVQVEAGAALAPALSKSANTLTALIHGADQATASVGGLGKVAEVTGRVGLGVATAGLSEVIPALFGTSHASETLSSKSKTLQDALTKVADLTVQGKTHTKEFAAAQKEVADSSGAVEKGQRAASKALGETAQQATRATVAMQALFAAQLAHVNSTLGLEGAQRNLATATQDYQSKLDALTKASGTDVPVAFKAVSDSLFTVKQQINATAQAAAQKAADDLGPNATAADKLKASQDAYAQSLYVSATSAIPAVAGQAQALILTYGQIPAAKSTVITADTSQAEFAVGNLLGKVSQLPGRGILTAFAGFNTAPRRASGGPVSAGRPFLVGENGPELMVPNRDGNIIPNGALGGGGRSTVVNVGVTVQGSVQSERDLVQAVRSGLVQALRTGNGSIPGINA